VILIFSPNVSNIAANDVRAALSTTNAAGKVAYLFALLSPVRCYDGAAKWCSSTEELAQRKLDSAAKVESLSGIGAPGSQNELPLDEYLARTLQKSHNCR